MQRFGFGASNDDGMYAVALGTAGGPKWWRHGGVDAGTSTAIIVDGSVYLVDFGYGAGRQFRLAGLDYGRLRSMFVTHMHSDHTVDLPGLFLFAHRDITEMRIFGPGTRGKLAPLTERARVTPRVISPASPVPGTAETVQRLFHAFAHDINDRTRDYGTQPQDEKFIVSDIVLPGEVPFDPDTNVAPSMEPFLVYEDDLVKVTAILVDHHPTAPAFAYRFDSQYGAVVVSGDTGYCENTIRIATGADVLFHEVISLEHIRERTEAEISDQNTVEAIMSHHARAHTTAEDAGRIAQAAGVKKLVLHHFAPGTAPRSAWMQAANTFDGELHIARDLDVIHVESVSISLP